MHRHRAQWWLMVAFVHSWNQASTTKGSSKQDSGVRCCMRAPGILPRNYFPTSGGVTPAIWSSTRSKVRLGSGLDHSFSNHLQHILRHRNVENLLLDFLRGQRHLHAHDLLRDTSRDTLQQNHSDHFNNLLLDLLDCPLLVLFQNLRHSHIDVDIDVLNGLRHWVGQQRFAPERWSVPRRIGYDMLQDRLRDALLDRATSTLCSVVYSPCTASSSSCLQYWVPAALAFFFPREEWCVYSAQVVATVHLS